MGYDLGLFVNLNQKYICNVCHEVLQDPKMCEKCESLFCGKCFQQALQVKQNCPVCRCQVKKIKTVHRLIRQNIEEMEMRCSNSGCNQQFQLKMYEKHLKECLFNQVTCQHNGCEQQMLVKDLQEHMINCEYRLEKCEECEDCYQKKEESKHSCIQILKQKLKVQEKEIQN